MDTNKYKEMLIKEKNNLIGLIGEMKDNTLFGDTTKHSGERYSSGELSSYDNHPADMGSEVYMQDMQNSLTIHEQGKLDNINQALDRIENNTYGSCVMCNKEIDEDRLEIMPETSMCVECTKIDEDKHYTSRENQNLINKGVTFYDEVNFKLQEINKMPHDFSNLD